MIIGLSISNAMNASHGRGTRKGGGHHHFRGARVYKCHRGPHGPVCQLVAAAQPKQGVTRFQERDEIGASFNKLVKDLGLEGAVKLAGTELRPRGMHGHKGGRHGRHGRGGWNARKQQVYALRNTLNQLLSKDSLSEADRKAVEENITRLAAFNPRKSPGHNEYKMLLKAKIAQSAKAAAPTKIVAKKPPIGIQAQGIIDAIWANASGQAIESMKEQFQKRYANDPKFETWSGIIAEVETAQTQAQEEEQDLEAQEAKAEAEEAPAAKAGKPEQKRKAEPKKAENKPAKAKKPEPEAEETPAERQARLQIEATL
jgi:hypothetical protein